MRRAETDKLKDEQRLRTRDKSNKKKADNYVERKRGKKKFSLLKNKNWAGREKKNIKTRFYKKKKKKTKQSFKKGGDGTQPVGYR